MFKKKNYKLFIGIIVGVILSVSGVLAASYKGAANDVEYDNGTSGLSSSNVQDALDELYNIKNCPDNTYCEPYKYELAVGDYVSYTPIKTSYTQDPSKTGHSVSDTFTINPSELNLWRVLNINSDGTIDLISEYVSSTVIVFEGLTGYQNFVGYLNTIAEQYETEGITEGSRCFGYNGQTEYITDTSMFTSTPPFGCSTDGKIGNCSNTTYPKDPDDYEAYGGGDTLYTTDYDRVNTVLGTRVAKQVGSTDNEEYWMASRYYYYHSRSSLYNWCGFYMDDSGSSNYFDLYYYSDGSFYDGEFLSSFRPIVTLKSGLEYEGLGTKYSPMNIITS